VLGETAPVGDALGVYVHVPFCARRCGYCAFNTAPLDDTMLRRYLAALHAEIGVAGTVPWARRFTVSSLFFGGGTPSLLEPEDLDRALEALRHAFTVSAEAEVTVECNPESVSLRKLERYRTAGVNRISLGVQSLDDRVLARIGRLHDARGARMAFDAAREAGFDNVSVDVMYGLPGASDNAWERTLRGVLDWTPEHLSAYGLSLDAGSLWGATGVEGLPQEERVVAQYWMLARAAAERGFEHYEISNYARPGFRARHNLTYWQRREYLAFGPGAAGFVGDVRYTNVKPTVRYCAEAEARRLPIDACERLDAWQALGERLILGLRLSDGVPAAWLDERADRDPTIARRLDAWRQRGLLERIGGRVRLSEAGFLLSDALFVELC
jgi:oxygen-independent coproporphyrinogen-3 oxidase